MKQLLLLGLLFLAILPFCTKGTKPLVGKGNQVKITTRPVSDIGPDSVTSGGTIEDDGGDEIKDRGVCWSSNSNPIYDDSKIKSGTGKGEFISKIKGLTANRQYYLRAYAINNSGTIYGNTISFKTTAALASVSSVALSSITTSSVFISASVTSDGGASVTQRGICWSTSSLPTISNNKTVNGSGTGSFSITLTGLSAGTIYYVRAYAINNAGTAYGPQSSFSTQAIQLPTVSTSSVSSVTNTTVVVGGSASADGGSTVTQKGICWATISSPTVSNNFINNGSGLGSFSSSISGLSPNTQYYARAYAKNSLGTAYGNTVSFITLLSPPSLISPLNGPLIRCCTVTLQWNAISGATQYDIQVSKNNSFSGSAYTLSTCGGSTNVQSSLLNTASVTSNSFCFNAGTATNNGVWYWRVRARNSNSTSDWSVTQYYNYNY